MNITDKNLSRRDIISAGVLGGLLIASAGSVANASSLALPKEDGALHISFRAQHTGESFNGAYKVGGRYLPEAFERINYVMRDFRTDEQFPIDPRLMDILYAVRRRTGVDTPFELLSGYRCPKTNARLARNSGGVARNSLHMTGQAVDVRLPGFSSHKMSRIAHDLRAGGVGFYSKSNFVHMDTGQVRYWT